MATSGTGSALDSAKILEQQKELTVFSTVTSQGASKTAAITSANAQQVNLHIQAASDVRQQSQKV
jgi:hypothetical protein